MNNKGFAITGILYTIFALFLLIIVAALANLSFKVKILSTSVTELEDELAQTLVSSVSEAGDKELKEGNGFIKDINNKYYAQYDGKYVFTLYLNGREPVTCTTYLKKTTEIPSETDFSEKVVFIPNDCNGDKDRNIKYKINIGESEATPLEKNMYLKEIYKFKESD